MYKEFPVTIVVPGEDGPTCRLGEKTLHFLPEIPAGAAMDLPDGGVNVTHVANFIRACIAEEDEEAFDAAVRSKTHVVSRDRLYELYMWLVSGDAYKAPFGPEQPPSSSNGHAPTGATSTDASLSPVSPSPT